MWVGWITCNWNNFLLCSWVKWNVSSWVGWITWYKQINRYIACLLPTLAIGSTLADLFLPSIDQRVVVHASSAFLVDRTLFGPWNLHISAAMHHILSSPLFFQMTYEQFSISSSSLCFNPWPIKWRRAGMPGSLIIHQTKLRRQTKKFSLQNMPKDEITRFSRHQTKVTCIRLK